MNIRTRGIQIQIFYNRAGQAKHSGVCLESPPGCDPAFASAQHPILPGCFNLPLSLGPSPSHFGRARSRLSHTLARLLTAQCPLAALPVLLPNI